MKKKPGIYRWADEARDPGRIPAAMVDPGL